MVGTHFIQQLFGFANYFEFLAKLLGNLPGNLLGRSLDFVYPPTCQVCGVDTVASDSKILSTSSLLCPNCLPHILRRHSSLLALGDTANDDLDFDPTSQHCCCCGELNTMPQIGNPACLPCIVSKAHYDSVSSLWCYEEEVEDLIKCYKYAGRRSLGRLLGQLLSAAVLSHAKHPDSRQRLLRADLILTVPSSTQIIRSRGFSHLGPIAKVLAKTLQIPYSPDALRSARIRQAQAELSPQKRRVNTRNAFAASATMLQNKGIILIDDVLTSGSTVDQASRALKAAGARRVDILTVARSNNFNKHRIELALQQPTRPMMAPRTMIASSN